jgi:hypothetical protein
MFDRIRAIADDMAAGAINDDVQDDDDITPEIYQLLNSIGKGSTRH